MPPRTDRSVLGSYEVGRFEAHVRVLTALCPLSIRDQEHPPRRGNRAVEGGQTGDKVHRSHTITYHNFIKTRPRLVSASMPKGLSRRSGKECVPGHLQHIDHCEALLLARVRRDYESVAGREQNLSLLRKERIGVDVAAGGHRDFEQHARICACVCVCARVCVSE